MLVAGLAVAGCEPAADGRAGTDPPAAPGALAPRWAVSASPALTWLEPVGDGKTHRLRFARREGDRWQAPVTVAEGDLFANWADVPAAAQGADGWVAHWLGRGGGGTYDYGIDLAVSPDGATWRSAGRLHDDTTPTEHGFVSWIPEGRGLRAWWLDGRETAEGGAMTLRTARVENGRVGAAEIVDDRVCDCCATTAAVTARGAFVAYRDRTDAEIRDISTRLRGSGGAWDAVRPLHADGWEIAGCPVNGPAAAAEGDRVAVAWYTQGGGAPQVRFAWSTDGGASFAPPVTLDAERPLGRVDVVLDGSDALVGWVGGPATAQAVPIRLARVQPDGTVGPALEVARTTPRRSSGFPRLRRDGEDVLVAWVDDRESPQHLRVTAVPTGSVR